MNEGVSIVNVLLGSFLVSGACVFLVALLYAHGVLPLGRDESVEERVGVGSGSGYVSVSERRRESVVFECYSCGYENESEYKYCGGCGIELDMMREV